MLSASVTEHRVINDTSALCHALHGALPDKTKILIANNAGDIIQV